MFLEEKSERKGGFLVKNVFFQQEFDIVSYPFVPSAV
jgi:hypothetical protein